MDNTYLCHHGVKGMHWGVRRYQNSDGSYTDKGKNKYGIQAARKYYKLNRLQRKQENTESFSKYRRLDKKMRRVKTRYDRKVAGLDNKSIEKGRRIVASRRATAKKIGLVANTAAFSLGVATIGSFGLPVMAVSAIGAVRSAYKLPYYQMESTMYKRREQHG